MTNIGDIIKKEMALNHFRPKRIRNVDYATVVAQIANCLYTTQHEREIVPTGVLFSNADLSNTEGIRLVEIPREGASELRSIADGRRTFLAYMGDPDPKLVVLTRAIGDETRLLELARMADGLVIKREVSGTVRLAQGEDIWLVENRNWNRKFGLLEHMDLVESCLGLMPGQLRSTLWSLLRLAYYFLSSRNIGTTLVWRVREPGERTVEGLSNNGVDVREMDLSTNDESEYSVIEHLLKYRDGAAIIGPTGNIEHVGTHLIYGDDAAEKIQPDGGTRHTSAKRFSFEHGETVVFVVSQDGPVSIYSDGYKVTEMATKLGSRVSSDLKKLVPYKAGDVDNRTVDLKCPNCARRIRIQEVIVIGWKDHESITCPCCQAPDVYSSMCWSLSAWPIKFSLDNAESLPSP